MAPRTAGRILLALPVLLVSTLMRVPQAAAALPNPITAGFLDFNGKTTTFADGGADVTVYTDDSTDHVRVFVQRPKGCSTSGGAPACTDFYVVRLQAAAGSPLAPGTYESNGSTSGPSVGLSVNVVGGQTTGYFTPPGGRFVVDQLAYSGTTVTSMSARFQASGASDGFHDGIGMPIFGAFSYNSTSDFRSERFEPGSLAFGGVRPGKTATATSTITNEGPSSLSFSASSITGSNAAEFSITSDTCSGTTVAAGQSCAITVAFHPDSASDMTADLIVHNELAPEPGPGRVIRLTGSGAIGHLRLGRPDVTFESETVGYFSDASSVTVFNDGKAPLQLLDVDFAAPDPDDFGAATNCGDVIPPGGNCEFFVLFAPVAVGDRHSGLMITTDGSPSVTTVPLSGTGTLGYVMATADGRVAGYGDAGSLSRPKSSSLNSPVVGVAMDPANLGGWTAGADGTVTPFGESKSLGSPAGHPLNQPITGIAPTPTGDGYWLVAADGGIFGYGDGSFYGSTGGIKLNKPIVGMTSTPSGRGYWLVASDGGIFAYGDAAFYGSTGSIHLNQPIVGMAAAPDGRGYWLVAADGGIFSFGVAPFFGSLGGTGVTNVVGLAMSGAPIDFSSESASARAAEDSGSAPVRA